MLVSPVAAGAAPAGVSGGSQDAITGSPGDLTHNVDLSDNSVEITDSISVWERSIIPLRADRDSAALTVEAPTVQVNQDGFATSTDLVDSFPVYDEQTTVDFTFDTTDTGSQDLNGEELDFFVVKLDEDIDSDDVDDTVPSSINELRDMFDKDDANANTTITKADTESAAVGSNGQVSFDHAFDDSGMYAVFASHGDGEINLDNGNFDSVSGGDVTIVGLESVAVQEESASAEITTDDAEAGDTIEFDVDANVGTDGDVNHALVVYNKEQFESSAFTINAPSGVDSDTSTDEFTIDHSIEEVIGNAELDGDVSVLNRQISERSASNFMLADAVNFIFDEAGVDRPGTNPGGDVLYASAVSIGDADRSETLTVETDDAWEDGEYKFVYVATGSDSTQFSTDKGTFDFPIEDEDDDDTGTGPITSPSPSPSPQPPAQRPQITPDNPSVETEVTEANASSTAVRITSGTSANVRFAETDEDRTSGVSFTDLNFTANQDVDFDVTSTRSRMAPSGTPDVTTSVGAFSYLQLDYADEVGQSVSDVQLRFSVSQERLDRNDVDPEDVVLLRQEGDDWNTLEPELRGERGDRYVFRANSPGLSVYAVSAQDDVDASVTDASLSTDEIEAGESVDVDATIENEGGAGEFTAELEVDGDVVAEETVDLDAGETTTVSFTETFDEAGSFDISVSGVTAGTLAVTDPVTETEPPATTEPPEDEGVGAFAWIILVLLLIAFAAGGAYYYQQQQEEDVEVLESDHDQ